MTGYDLARAVHTDRRYDIDWIRVIVFDILILYHVGMFFVPWSWHVKNNVIVDWMVWPMLFVNQWRLPILFVISGMGTRFALSSKSSSQYFYERLSRLATPLATGVLLVVPPQVYVERLAQGQTAGSFFTFYPHFFEGIYPNGNFSWHHLWFLPYLLLMSVAATPLFVWLRKENNPVLKWLGNAISKWPAFLYLFIVPVIIVEFWLEPLFPVNNALYKDWYALLRYTLLFISGFMLIGIGNALWLAVDRIKIYSLLLGVVSFPALLWAWSESSNHLLIATLKTLNMWNWIITIFACASLFLNKRSSLLAYRNQAVYPFYILHQTVTVVIGYRLMNAAMPVIWKFIVLVLGTYGFSWLIYEFIIRRSLFIGRMFGVRAHRDP